MCLHYGQTLSNRQKVAALTSELFMGFKEWHWRQLYAVFFYDYETSKETFG